MPLRKRRKTQLSGKSFAWPLLDSWFCSLLRVFSRGLCYKLLRLPFHLCEPCFFPLWLSDRSHSEMDLSAFGSEPSDDALTQAVSSTSSVPAAKSAQELLLLQQVERREMRPLTAAHKGLSHIRIWICEAKFTMKHRLWA